MRLPGPWNTNQDGARWRVVGLRQTDQGTVADIEWEVKCPIAPSVHVSVGFKPGPSSGETEG